MSTYPVIRVIDCHVCSINSAGQRQYLLMRRASGKIYANDWRMVGGKIETTASLQGISRETAWQAAIREVREETGLRTRYLYTVPYVNHFYEWQHDRINAIPVFVAVVENSAFTLNDEHSEARWVSLEEALQALPWPAQREGLQAADVLLASADETSAEAARSLAQHMLVNIR